MKVLLYSPDVVGHPRVYCRVIADSLAVASCEVIVAMGFTDTVKLQDCADLLPLANSTCVRFVDTRCWSASGSPHLKAEEIVELQSAQRAEVTLFVEADKSGAQFVRIANGEAPRLVGRNLGIFANTAEWYPGEDSYTGIAKRIIGPTIRRTVGNLLRLVTARRASARFFYENIIVGAKVLDEVIVKDERLATWRGPPVYWMPEITAPVSSSISRGDEEAADELRRRISAFLAKNKGREPLLYFGDAAFYKGYDVFLQFVAENPSYCAIHAGEHERSDAQPRLPRDVEILRGRLRAEGRLFETARYVHCELQKRLLFRSVRVYVSMHRLALSSATVLQALMAGTPVLVPNRGLLGYRVVANRLGEVYESSATVDLSEKLARMLASDLSRYAAGIRKAQEAFSQDAVVRFFRLRLLGTTGP